MSLDLQCYENIADEGYCSQETISSKVPKELANAQVRSLGFCKSVYDFNLLNDSRVLDNLLLLEEKCLPSANYLDLLQDDVKPWMRITVIKWMFEV